MNSAWQLNIGREIQEGVMVLTVTGRLGVDTSGMLIDALLEAMRQGQRRILVDLHGVDYMSSAGLLALDAAAGRMHQTGGDLVLCAACEPVRLVLEMSGVLADLPLDSSRVAGLERLRQSSGSPSTTVPE
jgi:anti-anti-sigma factor